MSLDELEAEFSYANSLYAPLAQEEASAQKKYDEVANAVKNATALVQQYEPLCTEEQNNLLNQQTRLVQLQNELRPLNNAHALLEKNVSDLQAEITKNNDTITQNNTAIEKNNEDIKKLQADQKRLNPKSQEYKNITIKINGENGKGGIKADSKNRTDENARLKKRNTDISAKNGLLSKAQKLVADNLKPTTAYMKKKTDVSNQEKIELAARVIPGCEKLQTAKNQVSEMEKALLEPSDALKQAQANKKANLLYIEAINDELSLRNEAMLKKNTSVVDTVTIDTTQVLDDTTNTSTTENNTNTTTTTEEEETMGNTSGCPSGKIKIGTANGRPICSCPLGCSENEQGQCGRWVGKSFWQALGDSITGQGRENMQDLNPDTGDQSDLIIGHENDFGQVWETC